MIILQYCYYTILFNFTMKFSLFYYDVFRPKLHINILDNRLKWEFSHEISCIVYTFDENSF